MSDKLTDDEKFEIRGTMSSLSLTKDLQLLELTREQYRNIRLSDEPYGLYLLARFR